MPRGYYLGQGLIPLGEHSSDDDEGPCELPNGRVVCGPHGLVVCPGCCSDYSFMDELSDTYDTNEDIPFPIGDVLISPGLEMRRGTGSVPATKYIAQSGITPTQVFSVKRPGPFGSFAR